MDAELELQRELALLEQATVPMLRVRYSEVFGKPATTDHPDLLRRQITYRLQEQIYGALPEELRQYAIAIAKTLPARRRLPRVGMKWLIQTARHAQKSSLPTILEYRCQGVSS